MSVDRERVNPSSMDSKPDLYHICTTLVFAQILDFTLEEDCIGVKTFLGLGFKYYCSS